MGDIGQALFRLRIDMTPLLYLMACLMSPAPRIDLAESRVEECLALGLDGVRGIVADSKACSRRTLGVCLEHKVDLITLVPRTCAVRQALESWGQQQPALPLLLEKPGRTRDEVPRR